MRPSEFPNALGISGAPPHLLRIKIAIPVTILRNLNTDRDMRNGANVIVRMIGQRFAAIDLFTGKNDGSRAFIPMRALQVYRYRHPVYFGAPPVPGPAAFCVLYE